MKADYGGTLHGGKVSEKDRMGGEGVKKGRGGRKECKKELSDAEYSSLSLQYTERPCPFINVVNANK